MFGVGWSRTYIKHNQRC